MTCPRDDDDDAHQDPALPKELSRALADLDLLVPETSAEVQRAERQQAAESLALPAGLHQFRARTEPDTQATRAGAAPPAEVSQENNVVSLRERRARSGGFGALGSVLGFALGAAAASVLWLTRAPEHDAGDVQVGGAGSELRERTAPLPEPVMLEVAACSECCAGNACSSAKPELTSCPSGRTCVGCSPGDAPSSYRIRISALALSDVGKSWVQAQGVQLDRLQLCASIQGRALGCRSAVESPEDLLDWVSLPVATVASQLVGGLSIALQTADARSLAAWSSSVTMSPEILCRGVAARLSEAEHEPLGRVSVFFDDAQYVELSRAATVAELTKEQAKIAIRGASLSIYETTAQGPSRFALVFGPTDRARAESVRWQLLEQKNEGRLTFGEDHKGRPRPR